ncbi:MAG: hypothetical protein HYX71_01405 [Opitutae bacterium]|nr:hypothetical protein [Opitutae bacterium]
MKRPPNLLALVFGALHLALCALFFAAYFLSPDSERGMALIVFWFIDPWVRLFFSGFSGSLSDEIGFAVAVTLFGTALWWAAGWLVSQVYVSIRKKEPIQLPETTRGKGM